jgi:membrane protein
MRLAAAVSFYAMMAIAPLLVVALKVLSLIYGRSAEQKIGQQMGAIVGTEGSINPAGVMRQILHIAAHQKHGALFVWTSAVIALISGSSLFACVQDAINTLWDIQPRPGQRFRVGVRNRLTAGTMLFVAAVLLIASFALSAVLTLVANHSGGLIVIVSYIGDTFISYSLLTLLLAAIFKFLPMVKIDWSDVWRGALITAALWVVGKIALALYFRFALIQNPYGAAGSLAALLIWVYYSATLIFLGTAFTRVYAESTGKPIEPDEYAVRVKQGI